MQKPSNRITAYLLVNLATLFWASNIAIGRALRDSIGPVTLSTLRFSIGGLIFALILFVLSRRGQSQQILPGRHQLREWAVLLGMGLSGVFAFSILLYLALQYTTAGHAALLIATGPLFTLLFSSIFQRQPVRLRPAVGMLISLAGVAVVIGGDALLPGGAPGLNLGDLLALLASALWGFYSILARQATSNRSTLSATAVSTWLAVPLLVLAATFELPGSPPTLSPALAAGAVYIGIFPTVGGFLAWNEGVRRVGPSQAMAFYNMLVVYGAMLSVLFLGEQLSAQVVAGGILVVAGGVTAAWSGKPRQQ